MSDIRTEKIDPWTKKLDRILTSLLSMVFGFSHGPLFVGYLTTLYQLQSFTQP